MAIFYKHIKGCGSNTTNDSGCWSWIEGSNLTTSTPKIYTKNSNSTTGRTDLGNIITSKASNQKIEQNFTFSGDLIADSIKTKNIVSNFNSKDKIYFTDSSMLKFLFDNVLRVLIDPDEMRLYNIELNGNGNVNFQKNLHVGDMSHTGGSSDKGIIKADSKCEALYFNAISDRRAKTNITPATFSALSTINALPVYTFNYKTKPEELTIGLIAQEAAEYDLDNFNMVDNLTATGENNDFMQMKESKLVYVLWKAVQELSAEVESLKQQLASK